MMINPGPSSRRIFADHVLGWAALLDDYDLEDDRDPAAGDVPEPGPRANDAETEDDRRGTSGSRVPGSEE